jgi:hypothetical protein
MVNFILISLAIYVITLFILFYINWCYYYDNDKSVKIVLNYMNWVEFVPLINTCWAVIMVGFFGMVIICNYIADLARFIEKLIKK